MKPEPRLLLRYGRFLPEVLAAERLTEGAVLSRVRGRGVSFAEEIAALVLETDASIGIIPLSTGGGPNGRLAVLDDVLGTEGKDRASY